MGHNHALRASRFGALALAVLGTAGATLLHAAAPTLSGTPLTSINVGSAYSFTPNGKDADGNRLTYSIARLPPWASFSTATGRLSGTPAAAHVRAWSDIVISVTDGTTKRSLPAFTILVRPASNQNQAPTISGSPATSAKVGTAYAFTPSTSDANKDKLTFSIANKPAWASFNTSTAKLSGTPMASNVGTTSGIRISVSDGKATASLAAFNITVSTSGGANSVPKISSSPATSVAVGTAYTFQPTASDANNDKLTFSVTSKPSWASFNTSTGKLSGTPKAGDLGTTRNIVISVSDGKASASLSAFSLAVTQIGAGAVTIDWDPPLRNTDGSALTNLAGYRIHYGRSTSSLTESVEIATAGVTRYLVENLSPGNWHFAVKSYNTAGIESDLSSVVGATIN